MNGTPPATVSREDVISEETESFTYDFLDRLTGVSGPYSESYTYDEIGNITSRNGVDYNYDSNQPHAVDSIDGSTSYTYDANGNMTTRGSQTIGWDVENRVVSVTGGASFVYDGDGNRVKKTENGETIVYVNQYYEKNLDTGVVTTYYYLGGWLVAMREGTNLKYMHQDHLSSTSVMTDTSGDSLGAIKYLPFGETRSGSVPTDKQFTGQRLDDTGLYYYGARYYDPLIGRFISADTIVPDSKNPQALNRYSYCINNPLSCIDPSGRDYIFVCGSGGKPRDWNAMITALNITNETVLIVYENPQGPTFGYPWEIGDQVSALEKALTNYDLTDIKIIGHSEGAAAIVTVLDKLANDDNFLAETNVRDELEAAVMLDCPTGIFHNLVDGWEDNRYNNLPDRLKGAEMGHVKLLDVWNDASPAHMPGPMPGWYPGITFPYYLDHGIFNFSANHGDPMNNTEVFEKVKVVAPSIQPYPWFDPYGMYMNY